MIALNSTTIVAGYIYVAALTYLGFIGVGCPLPGFEFGFFSNLGDAWCVGAIKVSSE